MTKQEIYDSLPKGWYCSGCEYLDSEEAMCDLFEKPLAKSTTVPNLKVNWHKCKICFSITEGIEFGAKQ